MNLQKQKRPEGVGTFKKHSEHQNITISKQKVLLISSILEQSKYQSASQRVAIVWIYQMILEAYLAAMLTFLEPSDEAVTQALLDSVDALAVAPIFDDDNVVYRDVLRAFREFVRLMNAGRITFRVISDGV